MVADPVSEVLVCFGVFFVRLYERVQQLLPCSDLTRFFRRNAARRLDFFSGEVGNPLNPEAAFKHLPRPTSPSYWTEASGVADLT